MGVLSRSALSLRLNHIRPIGTIQTNRPNIELPTRTHLGTMYRTLEIVHLYIGFGEDSNGHQLIRSFVSFNSITSWYNAHVVLRNCPIVRTPIYKPSTHISKPWNQLTLCYTYCMSKSTDVHHGDAELAIPSPIPGCPGSRWMIPRTRPIPSGTNTIVTIRVEGG